MLAEVLPIVCIFQTLVTNLFPSCFKVVFLITEVALARHGSVGVLHIFFGIIMVYSCGFWGHLDSLEEVKSGKGPSSIIK